MISLHKKKQNINLDLKYPDQLVNPKNTQLIRNSDILLHNVKESSYQ